MKFIATKNVRIRLTNGREIQLTKGEPIKPAAYSKLTTRQQRDYTEELLQYAQVTRRIPQRAEWVKQMGWLSDVNLIVMQAMTELFTNEELKALRTGQLGVMRKIEKHVIKTMKLAGRKVSYNGMTDDPIVWTEAKSWNAWPLHTDAEVAAADALARDFINDIYALV